MNTGMFSHDEISDIMGVPAKSLEDIYQDKAADMKRTMLEYIKMLRGIQNQATGPGPSHRPPTIELDADNYPIAPAPAMCEKLPKADLEYMYRTYLKQHYSTYPYHMFPVA